MFVLTLCHAETSGTPFEGQEPTLQCTYRPGQIRPVVHPGYSNEVQHQTWDDDPLFSANRGTAFDLVTEDLWAQDI